MDKKASVEMKFIIFLLVVIIALISAMGVYKYQEAIELNFSGKKGSDSGKTETRVIDDRVEFLSKPIEFSTNLIAEGKQNRYIKMSVVCMTDNKKILETLTANTVVLRDAYIKAVNSMVYEEITSNKVEYVKDIIEKVVREDVGININEIYIIDFMLQ